MGRFVAETTPRPYNQLRLLQVIASGEIGSQTSLAERMFLDPPAVSRAVDKLESDGLLRRSEGADRRCVKLEVTAAAAAELTHFDTGHDRLDDVLARYLDDDERAHLARLLTKLDAGLRLEDRGGTDDKRRGTMCP